MTKTHILILFIIASIALVAVIPVLGNVHTQQQNKDQNDQASKKGTNNQPFQYFYSKREGDEQFRKYFTRDLKLQSTDNKYQKNTIVLDSNYEPEKVQENQLITRVFGTRFLADSKLYPQTIRQFKTPESIQHYSADLINLPSYTINLSKKFYLTNEEERFLQDKHQGVYIMKTKNSYQLLYSVEDLVKEVKMKQYGQQSSNVVSFPTGEFTVQKYIENPILYHNKKITYRCYFAIVSTDPLVVLYFQGYSRQSLQDYDLQSADGKTHIDTETIQKGHAEFEKIFNEDRFYLDWKLFKYYLVEQHIKNFNDNDFLEMEQKIKAGVTYAVLAAQDKFIKQNGTMELLSVDVAVDDKLNPYIMDINSLPYVTPLNHIDIHRQVLPDITRDFIDAGIWLSSHSKEYFSQKSQENELFICDSIAFRNLCHVLINEATQFDYISKNKELISKWQKPEIKSTQIKEQMNGKVSSEAWNFERNGYMFANVDGVENHNQYLQKKAVYEYLHLQVKPENIKLKNEKNEKLQVVKDYYRPTKNPTLLTDYLQKLGVKFVTDPQRKFSVDLYYDVPREVDRSKLKKNQMTLNVTPHDKYLDDKLTLSLQLQQFDKESLFEDYDSLYGNPESYQIDFTKTNQIIESEKKFISAPREGMWILKPASTLQGQSIQLIQDASKLQEAIRMKGRGEVHPDFKFSGLRPENRFFVLQKYIENPLLQDGKKFDMRQFVAVLSTDPFIAIYFPGYTRKTMRDYDRFSDSEFVHLGNGDIAKKLPEYETKRQQDHNYDRELFRQKLINEHEGFTEKQCDLMEQKTKAAITYALLGAKELMPRRKGDSQLFSVDMIVDDNFNPFIVEFNRNPYLKATTEILQKVFPKIVHDWFDGASALLGMTKEQILQKSVENPKFICEIADRHDCDVLVNDAVNFSYLDEVDFEAWERPELPIYTESDKEKYYKELEQKKEFQRQSKMKQNNRKTDL